MAIDSQQKRMAAINLACPWRGPLVVASEPGFQIDNRAAAAFMYSLASTILQAVSFTLSVIQQVTWDKLKSQPQTKFKIRTLTTP